MRGQVFMRRKGAWEKENRKVIKVEAYKFNNSKIPGTSSVISLNSILSFKTISMNFDLIITVSLHGKTIVFKSKYPSHLKGFLVAITHPDHFLTNRHSFI